MTSLAKLLTIRVPISVKILTVGTICLVAMTVALTMSTSALIQAIAYKQVVQQVQVGQNTLWHLV